MGFVKGPPCKTEDRNKWLFNMLASVLYYGVKTLKLCPKMKWLKRGTLGLYVL